MSTGVFSSWITHEDSMCWVNLVHHIRSLSGITQTSIELPWTLTLTPPVCVAVCDTSISAHFVHDFLASAHANTHTQPLGAGREDHSPDPNGKWHNRDIKAFHLRPRRAASYQLRWGSTLVPLWGNVGHFCTSGPVKHFIWRLGSVPTPQLAETGAK